MQLADAIMAPCTWVPGRRAECLGLSFHLSWSDLVTAAELLEELPRLVSDLVDSPFGARGRRLLWKLLMLNRHIVLNISVLVGMCHSGRFFWKPVCCFWVLDRESGSEGRRSGPCAGRKSNS